MNFVVSNFFPRRVGKRASQTTNVLEMAKCAKMQWIACALLQPIFEKFSLCVFHRSIFYETIGIELNKICIPVASPFNKALTKSRVKHTDTAN